MRKCPFRLISQDDTIILKLKRETLQKMRLRSKNLDKLLRAEKKVKPEFDFTTFITYKHKLSMKQLILKFKRAVSRCVM